jgi:hypothetical protein
VEGEGEGEEVGIFVGKLFSIILLLEMFCNK